MLPSKVAIGGDMNRRNSAIKNIIEFVHHFRSYQSRAHFHDIKAHRSQFFCNRLGCNWRLTSRNLCSQGLFTMQ